MGFYNMVFGRNPVAPLILAALDLTPGDAGRFRDAFVSDGKIAIYTRNGGGNREDYMPDFSGHPFYLSDADDDFDNTYATIYFRFPPQHADLLAALDTGKFDPSARWADMLRALKDGKRPDVVEAMRPTMEAIVKALEVSPAPADQEEP